MNACLYRESYKLSHRKVAWFAPILVLFVMVAMGFSVGKVQARLLAMTCFASSEVILLALVIVASSIFSMEFQNQAILTVMYKAPNKLYVYFAKLVTIFIYNLILHLIAMLFTFILTLTPIVSSFSWLAVYQHHQPLIVNMLATTGLDLVTSTFIISMIFLTSCIINSNAVVVTFNIVVIYMGAYVSYHFLLDNAKLAYLLKWNPFNMTNLTQQYYNSAMVQATSLSVFQLTIGTLAYSLLFFALGYLVFRKKRF